MPRKKSVFRYPGGKYKAIKYIRPFWKQIKHDEYREPFVGGGSVFISKPLVKINWINDIDDSYIAFYKTIQEQTLRRQLIDDLLSLNINKETYDYFYNLKPKNNFEKAKRIYVLNRCSFSGITRWNSFIGDVRYNISSTKDAIEELGKKLANVKITSTDFEEVINSPKTGEGNVFMYLDPPYAESRQIVAYNKTFDRADHERLCKVLKKIDKEMDDFYFLLSYDNCEYIRSKYDWANQYSCSWTYSVANANVHHNPRESGNELFISNIKLKKTKQLMLDSV